jgi:RNA polymerase sigma factor (sigma-70 family)
MKGMQMTTAELQERFAARIDQHKKILWKICTMYCKNRDDREDIAQEILIQLWRSFKSFDDRCRFSTWMYRVALNVAISFYRRDKVRTRHVMAAGPHLLETVQAVEEQSEDVRLLYQWIEGQAPLNKALVMLYLDGNSYQEIADVLGITQTNVATKINRLKQIMKRDLG